MRKNEELEQKLQDYYEQLFGLEDQFKIAARKASDSLNLSKISLSMVEASVMAFLIRQHQCQKFVEIGTLTGYSALWILGALPENGKLWTFEKDPKHALLARNVLQHDQRVSIHEGDAQQNLMKIENEGPFDGIFIDGNKAAYPDYLAWSEKNLKSGGLVIADNIFLGGSVYGQQDPRFSEKQVAAMRKFNARLADSKVFCSTFIPTSEGLMVGIKR